MWKKIRLSKCIKHFDSKCVLKSTLYVVYFDAICENLFKQISIDLISLLVNLCELGQKKNKI